LGASPAATAQATFAAAAAAAAASPKQTLRGADGLAAFSSTVAQRAFRDESAQQEAAKRVSARLAEIGCDPSATTATEVLQTLYTRESRTAYWYMNREAEKRLRLRPHTPRSFAGMLSPHAHAEVRRARDLPLTDIGDALDSWEVDTLADVCRSLRHFDETQKGNVSEYKSMYTHKTSTTARQRLGTTT